MPLKHTFIIATLFVLFSLFTRFTYASVLPTNIAINDETKECGGYWQGDDTIAYDLPIGWKSYYPQKLYTINTEFGSCIVTDNDSYFECCTQLNLKPVNPVTVAASVNNGNCAYDKTLGWDKIGTSTSAGVAINRETGECTAYLKFRYANTSCNAGNTQDTVPLLKCLENTSWQNTKLDKTLAENTWVTPYGNCAVGSIESCCQKLDLKYVSDNIGVEGMTNGIAGGSIFTKDVYTDGILPKSQPRIIYALAIAGGVFSVFIFAFKSAKKL